MEISLKKKWKFSQPNQPTNQPRSADSSLQRHIHHQLPKGPNRPMKAAIVPGQSADGFSDSPTMPTKPNLWVFYTPKKIIRVLSLDWWVFDFGKRQTKIKQVTIWRMSRISALIYLACCMKVALIHSLVWFFVYIFFSRLKQDMLRHRQRKALSPHLVWKYGAWVWAKRTCEPNRVEAWKLDIWYGYMIWIYDVYVCEYIDTNILSYMTNWISARPTAH